MHGETSILATDHNAVPDGRTKSHGAIQAVIDAADARGGGMVVLTPGVYLSGGIRLRSRVTLHLEPGAVLRGSPDLEDYPAWEEHEHNIDRRPWHLVYAADEEDVRITGGGTIDGNGSAFWEATTPHESGDAVLAVTARDPDPARARLMWIKAHKEGRPSPMVELRRCRGVSIEGVTLTDSPGWTCHTLDCDRVRIHGVTLTSNLMGPNNDGFDISGCHGVTVSDCHISCCDDAICLKTSPDSRTCEHVAVTNCVIRCWCCGIKVGTESARDVRGLAVSNCSIFESSRAFGLYAYDGGTVEDIVVDNLVCDTRAPLMMNRPIHLDCRPRHGTNEDSHAGAIRNVMLRGIIARTDGRVVMTGCKSSPLRDIVLRDVQLVYPTVDDPAVCGREVGGAQFSAHLPEARAARAAVVVAHIDGLTLENVQTRWPEVDESGRVETPERWRFPLKAANGSEELYPRERFNTDRLPPMHAVWARAVRGGWLHNPGMTGASEKVARYHLEDCAQLFAEDD